MSLEDDVTAVIRYEMGALAWVAPGAPRRIAREVVVRLPVEAALVQELERVVVERDQYRGERDSARAILDDMRRPDPRAALKEQQR